MLRWRTGALVAGVSGLAAVALAGTKFQSTWKAPDAGPLNFKGKKVAALVISTEEALRRGAEFTLAKEITAKGAVGVAAYSLIPTELIKDKDKAREILEKEGVAGVVVMRVVGRDQQMSSSSSTYYSGSSYATFWGPGYYGFSWGGVYDPGYVRTDTKVYIETLVYSLEQDKLVWAGRSETTNPSKVAKLVEELTSKAAGEMKKQGLIR